MAGADDATDAEIARLLVGEGVERVKGPSPGGCDHHCQGKAPCSTPCCLGRMSRVQVGPQTVLAVAGLTTRLPAATYAVPLHSTRPAALACFASLCAAPQAADNPEQYYEYDFGEQQQDDDDSDADPDYGEKKTKKSEWCKRTRLGRQMQGSAGQCKTLQGAVQLS